jgi:hypothetical protein
MSGIALAAALLAFSIAACLFALVKGGVAERIGAGIILANLVAGEVQEALYHNQILVLCIDGLTALALLGVAIRYASFWLGGVMLLCGLQFALHASYFVLERPRDSLHVAINNTNFVAIAVCLAAGTALAWRRRVRATRVDVAAAA